VHSNQCGLVFCLHYNTLVQDLPDLIARHVYSKASSSIKMLLINVLDANFLQETLIAIQSVFGI
jgi:hypothetical protein